MPSREKTTRHRDRYLWTTYRITQAEYDAMYDRQGGVCAICQEPESDTSHLGTPKHMAVDHDHNCCPGRESCGRCVRALLCTRCNQGLGHFRDDIEVLRAAVAYLAHHERVRTDSAA